MFKAETLFTCPMEEHDRSAAVIVLLNICNSSLKLIFSNAFGNTCASVILVSIRDEALALSILYVSMTS